MTINKEPESFTYTVISKFKALELTQDISMVANASDFLVVSDTGYQAIMPREEFFKFVTDIKRRNTENAL
jgi:hypothetical protein